MILKYIQYSKNLTVEVYQILVQIKFVINIDCPNDIKQKLYEQCLKQKIKIQPEEGYIDYIDANSLYARAIRLPLPVSDFRLIHHEESKNDFKFILNNCNIGCEKHINMVANCNDCFSSILNLENGYLVEYDIIYPKKLHDYHNDLPLAPENIVINKSL